MIFSVIGFSMMVREGVQMDLEHRKFRTIKSIFAIHVGKWKDVPSFDYISVFKTVEGKQISVATASTIMRDEVYMVNLFYADHNYVTFYKSGKKEESFKIAMQFSRVLNIRILDATELQSVWIE